MHMAALGELNGEGGRGVGKEELEGRKGGMDLIKILHACMKCSRGKIRITKNI